MLSLLSTIYMYMHGVIIAADISLYYNITHIGIIGVWGYEILGVLTVISAKMQLFNYALSLEFNLHNHVIFLQKCGWTDRNLVY